MVGRLCVGTKRIVVSMWARVEVSGGGGLRVWGRWQGTDGGLRLCIRVWRRGNGDREVWGRDGKATTCGVKREVTVRLV